MGLRIVLILIISAIAGSSSARIRITSKAEIRSRLYGDGYPGSEYGWIDVVTRNAVGDQARFVEGWAWDWERPNEPVWVRVYFQGRLVGEGLADRYREDLVAAGKGNGRHGYRVPIGVIGKRGRLSVKVGRNNVAGSPIEIWPKWLGECMKRCQ